MRLVLKHLFRKYPYRTDEPKSAHCRREIHQVCCSLGFVSAIKAEVILSFLGLGVEPGIPSWGTMIDDAKLELARGVWWNLAAATLFMFGLILAFNLFNDALRDALDPKLKNK